jgi:hypothetical protein
MGPHLTIHDFLFAICGIAGGESETASRKPQIANPYRLIAPAGQVSTQTPQSTQESELTFALFLSILIALLGHSCTQDSQPVHFPLSTCAGIQQPFQEPMLTVLLKEQSIIPGPPAISTQISTNSRRNARRDDARSTMQSSVASSSVAWQWSCLWKCDAPIAKAYRLDAATYFDRHFLSLTSGRLHTAALTGAVGRLISVGLYGPGVRRFLASRSPGRERASYCGGPAGGGIKGRLDCSARAILRTYSLGSFWLNQSITF